MKTPFIDTNPARIIGLMSGTSHDGVDAALALIGHTGVTGFEGIHVKVLRHVHIPYPPELRDEISLAFSGDTAHLCRLNFTLGEVFASAALKLMEAAGVGTSGVDAVASHGQTVYHIPPDSGNPGSTLQIGEASVIAVRTGLLTISDFRTKDVALGGQGAPLVPIADYILFHKPGTVRAVLNVGGIANASILRDNPGDIVAFDTGPGNSLMDDAVKLRTGGNSSFDREGAWAGAGKPNRELLKELLSNPYFRKHQPKSTGRELFGMDMVNNVMDRYGYLALEDLLATFAHLTAQTIYDALAPYEPGEVIVTGGGCKNLFLMSLLRERFEGSGTALTEISGYGVSPEEKEAVSFAILGFLALWGMPGNVPSATGATRGAILGKITLPG